MAGEIGNIQNWFQERKRKRLKTLNDTTVSNGKSVRSGQKGKKAKMPGEGQHSEVEHSQCSGRC